MSPVTLLRRLILAVVLGGALALGVRFTTTPADGEWYERTLTVLVAVVSWLIANAQPVAIALGALVALWLVWKVASLVPRTVHKDPKRLFSSEQRRIGFTRAGRRCEMDGLLVFTRCRRAAEHGDHWIPHSKGGMTNMENFVAACAICNLAKSNRTPSRLETFRLESRRQRYFPDSVPVLTPGAKMR